MSLAVGGIYRNISRTGLAIAALSIAVSATFGVDIMIGSFRSTVDQWLRTTLQSDVYVTAPSTATTTNARLPEPDSLLLARAIPGIDSVSSGLTTATRTSAGISALLALHLERAREFAILRATGATRRRIVSVVLTQTLLMGVLAGVLALPLGWMMSEVLIKVINVRSFGWSMQSMMPVGSVPETFSLAILSAILAGLYPAYRLSRRGIAAQLRED